MHEVGPHLHFMFPCPTERRNLRDRPERDRRDAQVIDIQRLACGDQEPQVPAGCSGWYLEFYRLIADGSALDLGVRLASRRTERRPDAVPADTIAPQFHSRRDRFIGDVNETVE